jgi:hypothetical protein
LAIIIRGKSKCAICDTVIGEHDELVATCHFISEYSDPLWRYSDAPFHFACFQEWGLREQFVAKFNDAMKTTVFGSGKRHCMRSDGLIETVPIEETPGE